MISKSHIKNISPKLSNNKDWHAYVDWFYKRPELRNNYGMLAMGFEAGSRNPGSGENN